MAQTITFSQTLVTETCCSCGVLFAMPEDLNAILQRKSEERSFYCPNGHKQWYMGKSDEQLRMEAEAKAARLQARLDQARANEQSLERRLSAQKAQTTKARKRAAATACPAGCNRTFAAQGMHRHLTTKHPNWSPDGDCA